MLKKIFDPIEVDSEYFSKHEAEENELHAKIRATPESVSDLLFGVETPEIIEKICQNYQLNDKQSAELSRSIRKILTAEFYLGDIVSEIASKLVVGQDVAREIANRLITELFAPALEDIKKLHIEKFGSKQEPAPTPIPAPKANDVSKPEGNINPN